MRISNNLKRSLLDGQLRLARSHPATLPLSLLCNLVLVMALLLWWRPGAAVRQEQLASSSGLTAGVGSSGGQVLGGGGGAADMAARLQQAEQLLQNLQSETGVSV